MNYKNSFPDYGYRVDISQPKIKELYFRYKKWKGIPDWCPLSDSERLEFERYLLKGSVDSESKSKNNA